MKRLGNSLVTSITALIASASVLAACGGGGGGSSPATVPGALPTAAPTAAPQPYPTTNLVLTFPYPGTKGSSNARGPRYVSPNSTLVQFIINTINGVAPTGALAAIANQSRALTYGAGGTCTVAGGTATCTVPVITPPGTLTYTIKTFDGSSNLLSTGTGTTSITAGLANPISVTMKGVVATVTVAGAGLTADTPIAAGETLAVGAADASGAQIVNGTTSANYANPIKLTDTDATGSTSLSVNGGTAASTVTVNNPADVVKLIYTGQAVNNFTITAGVANAGDPAITGGGTITTTVNDITFSGTTLDDPAHGGLSGDPNYNAQTVFFAQASGSQNITGAELGFTDAPYSKTFDLTLSSACTSNNIASASGSPATTFTIIATGGVGICSARMTEHGTGYPITQHPATVAGSATQDGTFYISVTSSNISVNARTRHH